ncbi:MAG: hypothetical protein ACXABY_29620 [Candidatus Thorarchaeota archaeon]
MITFLKRKIRKRVSRYLVSLIDRDDSVRHALVRLTLDYNQITIEEDGTVTVHWKNR